MSRGADVSSVIIVAAGAGERFGSRIPKQFLPIWKEKNALQISGEKFQQTGLYSEIIFVLPPKYIRKVKILLPGVKIKVTAGGKTRVASVINGLKMLDPEAKLVAIHDAVRPLVSREIIHQATEAAKNYGAAVVGKIASDTVKVLGWPQNQISRTLERKKIFLAQTPQIFSRQIILAAYQKLSRKLYSQVTDDSQVVEIVFPKQKIIAVINDTYNEKITVSEDLLLAKFWLKHNL